MQCGRGLQILRPWRISVSETLVQCLAGKSAVKSASTASAVLNWVKPRRRETRRTCRSTGKPGTLSACPNTTLAVFRPTPGSLTSDFIDAGTVPSWSSASSAAAPLRDRALERKNPVGLTNVSSSSRSASASDLGFGNLLNRSGVTLFTRSSVHCADKIVATNNSNGFRNLNSV